MRFPVSLVGTFTILVAFGISLNNLSLFGLVLAVGIVVDDAIVVVENVERNMRDGVSPLQAAHRTMDEVGGALISIALTLCAVFVPSAFISGISGLFFRQFAVTISASTVISCFVSLTLSPALCAVLFKTHYEHDLSRAGLARRLLYRAFNRFNRGFDRLSSGYGNLTRRLVRGTIIVLVVYAGLIGVAAVEFSKTPTGFIPEQDQGYLINLVQLPAGSALDRTEKVVRRRHRRHSGDEGCRACGALRRLRCDDLHGRVECSNDLLRLAVTLQSRASGRDREHGDRRPA